MQAMTAFPAAPGAGLPSKLEHEHRGPLDPRARKRVKRALVVTSMLIVTLAGGWSGVRYTTWFGPCLADGARVVLGTRTVARIEDWSAYVEDQWLGLWFGPTPRTLDEARVPIEGRGAVTPAPVDSAASTDRAEEPRFRPVDIGPMASKVAANGDGVWVPVPSRTAPEALPQLWTTLLHPDVRRPWAEVFVVAVDAKRTRLELVTGTVHPKTEVFGARSYVRSGRIPEQDRSRLLAAFNGGFKAEHGHYGIHVDRVTLIAPRDTSCTIGRAPDAGLRIGTWKTLASEASQYAWWRQTPPCLVENGVSHPALRDEGERRWGAMVGGDTVIRRSALGLDREGNVLFVSVSNFTTAQAIAVAMRHAGAWNVAELDVNWSFPHVVVFVPDEAGELVATGLFRGFLFDEDRYLRQASSRDFFYLVGVAGPNSQP